METRDEQFHGGFSEERTRFTPTVNGGTLSLLKGINATAFVVPFRGHNFGVGEEAGSVLENLADTHGERLIFVHEDDVTSAMIRSASDRWDLRVETYETKAELVSKLRRFAAGIMHRERLGELDHIS